MRIEKAQREHEARHIAEQLKAHNEQLRQLEAAQKTAEVQAALAKVKPVKLTARQEALMRRQGFLSLSQAAMRERLSRQSAFKSLKQRQFEKKYPGYYYNEEYF